MSTGAKLTLLASCAFTVGIIGYVHLSQKNERDQMKIGVQMDLARQKLKKSQTSQSQDDGSLPSNAS